MLGERASVLLYTYIRRAQFSSSSWRKHYKYIAYYVTVLIFSCLPGQSRFIILYNIGLYIEIYTIIILSTALYGCVTLLITLLVEHRFGCLGTVSCGERKWKEVRGGRRISRSDVFRCFCPSQNVIRLITGRKISAKCTQNFSWSL
jgi:hypothetical protein